jgi:hypothetical protein
LSEYAFTDTDLNEVNGRVNLRKKLFADSFMTSDVEQFSAIFDMRLLSKAVFQMINKGASNAAKFTVYGAIDPNVKWEPFPNSQNIVLAASSSLPKTLTDAYGFVRVGVVSNIPGASTTFQVLAEAKSR